MFETTFPSQKSTFTPGPSMFSIQTPKCLNKSTFSIMLYFCHFGHEVAIGLRVTTIDRNYRSVKNGGFFSTAWDIFGKFYVF